MRAAAGGSWATLGSRLTPSNLMLPLLLRQIDRRQMYKKDTILGPGFGPVPSPHLRHIRPPTPRKYFFCIDKDVSTLC
jgi:hypothetical protein